MRKSRKRVSRKRISPFRAQRSALSRKRVSRRRASRKRASRRRASRRRASRSPRVIWHETTPITKPKYFSEPTYPPLESIQTGNCEGYWGAPLSTQEKKKYDFHTKKGERGYIKDMPVISSKKWSDKNKFLNMLKVIEDQSVKAEGKYVTECYTKKGEGKICSRVWRNFDTERYSGTTNINYRGLSPCRIEIRYVPVGNKEFREYENGKSIICWPEGYGEHYIGKHNVMPTEKFFNYVINKYEEVGRKRISRRRISRKRAPKVRTSHRTSRASRRRERKYIYRSSDDTKFYPVGPRADDEGVEASGLTEEEVNIFQNKELRDLLICEEEIEKCNEERRIQKHEFEQEVAKLEEARFDNWFLDQKHVPFLSRVSKSGYAPLHDKSCRCRSCREAPHAGAHELARPWWEGPDVLLLLQKCEDKNECPGKFKCYENYCIPPPTESSPTEYLVRFKNRIDKALGEALEEKEEIQSNRNEMEKRKNRIHRQMQKKIREEEIKRLFLRAGGDFPNRSASGQISAGPMTLSRFDPRYPYSFNSSRTSSISSAETIDEETAANLERWLSCEEKLDDCKKLKQKEKAKFDDILRKLKNK